MRLRFVTDKGVTKGKGEIGTKKVHREVAVYSG